MKKWDNSAAVRIPSVILKAINSEIDADVDVREEDGGIVIEPVRAKTFDLDSLVKGITPANTHDEVDFGLPAGKEVW